MKFSGASTIAYAFYGILSCLSVFFVGLKPIFSHGLLTKLIGTCSGGPLALSYTGMGALDQVLCFLIAIIHCVFDEEVKPLIRYTLSVIPVVIVFMYVESGRRRGLMSHPLIFSMAWQVMSWALILSIYSLIFVTSAPTPQGHRISEKRASSILVAFAVAVAFVLYTLFLQHPQMTAVWQVSPVIIWFAQKVSYRWILPGGEGEATGHGTVIAMYVASFLVGAPYHCYVVVSQWGSLYSLFMPILDAQDGPLTHIVHELLKWDLPIGSCSILIATLWFARTKPELLSLLTFVIGGSVMIGPAGALAVVMIWRERGLAIATEKGCEKA